MVGGFELGYATMHNIYTYMQLVFKFMNVAIQDPCFRNITLIEGD